MACTWGFKRCSGGGGAYIAFKLEICPLGELKATLRNKAILAQKAKELEDLFKCFFTHKPKPISTAVEFANALAIRTSRLKDRLINAQNNSHIQGVYNTFKKFLYKQLAFDEFADSFAQTLTYSLFLARLNHSKELDLYNAKKFIPKSFPLLRAMSDFLNQLEDLVSIQWLLDEICYIINHIDIASIIHELNKSSEKDLLGTYTTAYTHKDPYLHFYETFLSQYDRELRKKRGVYYTPASVVCFIINAIDSVLRADFSLQKGLGASLEDNHITLLDFATGTGTFLLEAFRKALADINRNSPDYQPKRLLRQFCGFEYLIAPYTIAHLRLSQIFKEEFGAELKDGESLNIRLTNTLYAENEQTKRNEKSNLLAGIVEFADEFKAAQEIKEDPILIITGNPPYSGASANKGLYGNEVRISYGIDPSKGELEERQQKEIEQYLKIYKKYEHLNKEERKRLRQDKNADYKNFTECKSAFKSIFESKKLEEQNSRWLLDDYVKFIRFAESKIQKQGSGIFAFISNNNFLDAPTIRGMRYSLLKSFDEIYILDLHGSVTKKEVCPDGSKDENVFGIKGGVSINVFVKNGNCHTEALAEVSQNKRVSKRDSSGICPQNDKTGNTEEVSSTKPLAKIYHYDLYGKCKDKYNFLYENTLDSIAWKELKPNAPFYLFIPQNGPRENYDKGWSVKDIFGLSSRGIVGGRDMVVSNSDDEKSLQDFKARILRFLELGVEEARKEFNLPEDSEDWKIEYAQKELRDTNNAPNNYIKIHYRPFDYRWTYYTCNSKGFLERPRGKVMKHFLGDFKNLDSQRIENFTPEFRDFIDSKYNEHFSPEAILGYIYAVLFHKDYREKYIDFLKIDFPKIPFVESKEMFLKLSALGQELIAVHLMNGTTDRQTDRKVIIGCNIGLNVARQYKMSGSWQCVIAINTLVDLSLMGGGNTGAGTIFPLYLKA